MKRRKTWLGFFWGLKPLTDRVPNRAEKKQKLPSFCVFIWAIIERNRSCRVKTRSFDQLGWSPRPHRETPLPLLYLDFPVVKMIKNLPAMEETQVWSLSRKIPWRREWQPSPVFLPGESHGQRSHSPLSCKESDMTEGLTFSLSAISTTLFAPQPFP